ncbi:MAG: redoxin domain-containing protein [Pyrinomonadaceae bacterium]
MHLKDESHSDVARKIMKTIAALFFLLCSFMFAHAQNEQAPIVEKEIDYKDWKYKSLTTDTDLRLSEIAKGKKLVLVAYYAPWCSNWKHDAPILQRLYDKYKLAGLEIVAVGEYDPAAQMKDDLKGLRLTFPAVYESQDRAAREKTLHFTYRRWTGDSRKWGSPWYIFIEPSGREKAGDTLTRKTFVINGEIIEAEGEAFIRKRLGLSQAGVGRSGPADGKIEICEPDTKVPAFRKP